MFDWTDLREVLQFGQLSAPHFRIVHDTHVLPPSSYATESRSRLGAPQTIIDAELLLRQLTGGATIVLDHLDMRHANARSAAECLEAHLGHQVGVTLYATWSNTPGFSTHWDDHDVIVLQVAGAKRWELFGQTRTDPIQRDIADNVEAPVEVLDTHVLTAGQSLFVPRGHWHRVSGEPSAGPSLHLTLSLWRPTNSDFLTWMADELVRAVIVRRDFTGSSIDQLAVAKLASEFLASPINFANFPTHHRASMSPRSNVLFPHDLDQLDTSTLISWLHPLACVRDAGDSVIISLNGEDLTFPLSYRDLVRHLMLISGLHSVSQLVEPTALSLPVVIAQVRTLARMGLIKLTSR